ncbi:MAG: YitT family protein [Chloroflexi bacterium]|nr:YitT family protein [Chloroflexota bacterium]
MTSKTFAFERTKKALKKETKTSDDLTNEQSDVLAPKSQEKAFWEDVLDFFLCMLGGMIYSIGINTLILPFGLYIGNMTGIAKIVLELLQRYFPNLQDATGLILLAFNLPLLLIAFNSINRKFFMKTIITVVTVSAVMMFIPVKAVIPGLDDMLTLAILGGILCGFGVGLSLRAGGSSGGVDILGVLITLKKPDFSVGRVSLFISLLVYAYTLFTGPPVILVYSVIFTLIYSLVVDRVHYQNVKISVMVISKNKDILQYIIDETHRSATYWGGHGAYSGADFLVINTVVSKYELLRLRRGVVELDPQAFIIENNSVNVTGYFPSHFF